MYDSAIHLYEKLPLFTAGAAMGIVLILLHLAALLWTDGTIRLINSLHKADKLAQALLGVDFAWLMLLLFKSESNPLCMDLFEFEAIRKYLFFLCPVVWFVMATMVKENLFGRALGMFLLMMAIVPMSAAFLKEPATRILIPLWWYPVLTIAMFWVAKPYLFRDWMARFTAKRKLFRLAAAAGLAYAVVLFGCAVAFWR